MKQNNYTGLEIAVIGMACRFPGAPDVEAYWENIKNGVISVSQFSEEELRQCGIAAEELLNPRYVKAKGVIDDAAFFDAAFFGLTPAESNTLDPQVRILLQCAYHALEDSGFRFGNAVNNVGVFAGGIPNVGWQAERMQKAGSQYEEQFSSLLLNDKDFISSRISFLMNLHGPSTTVYTACSTALVAVDAALQSLLTGKCDTAIAGGVALSLPCKSGYTWSEGMMMSDDGCIRSFDAGASGTVWGDGAGVVVLKRLDDALSDGDNIHAIIKGIAVNNDGNRKIGYTAYSAKGQVEVMKNAYLLAETEPGSISYIEGHGSGTPLGDKIEMSALMEVFGQAGADFRCALGSVKPNISNLNVASGMASLIKVCLMLKHSQIPPAVNFRFPNSKLAEPGCTFYVNEKLQSWESEKFPLRAAINSFGIGGTNAHIILEKAPVVLAAAADERPQVICLSAKTPAALEQLTRHLAAFAQKDEAVLQLSNAAYTLQRGREQFAYRRFLVAGSVKDITEKIAEQPHTQVTQKPFPVIFAFSAIKDFQPGPAEDLCRSEPCFREAFNSCLDVLQSLTGKPFRTSIFGEDGLNLINGFGHCLGFSFQYAIAVLLSRWGIKPDYKTGWGAGVFASTAESSSEALKASFEMLLKNGAAKAEHLQLLDAMAKGSTNAVVINIGTEYLTTENMPVRVIEISDLENAGIITHVSLLNAIGTFWSWGGDIDWQSFHFNENKQKISLPLYPFEKTPFSIDISSHTLSSINSAYAASSNPAHWFYVPSWKKTPKRPAFSENRAGPQHLLILQTIGMPSVQDAYRSSFETVVVATGADSFTRESTTSYKLNWNRKEDLLTLFAHLKTAAIRIDAVLDLTSLGIETGEDNSRLQRTVHLAQAYSEAMPGKIHVVCWIACNSTFPVVGNEITNPSIAALAAAVSHLPRKYPGFSCHLADFDALTPGSNLDFVFKQLLKEIKLQPEEKIISYRGTARWAPSMEPYPLSPENPAMSGIKNGGVYLIQDNFGETGFAVASYLLKNYQVKVILAGFSQIPAEVEWENWLSEQGADNAVSRKITQIITWRNAGTVVLVTPEYVTHTAAIVQPDAVILSGIFDIVQPDEHIARIAPRLHSIKQLIMLAPAGFVVQFFPVPVRAGTTASMEWFAAKHFADVFAQQENKCNTYPAKWISVTTNSSDVEEILQRLLSVRNEEYHITVSPGRHPLFADEPMSLAANTSVVSTIATKAHRPSLETPYAAPTSGLEEKLVCIWQELLEYTSVGIHDDFFILGGNSLGMIRLITRIHKYLGVHIDIETAFQNRTIAAQALLIAGNTGEGFEHIQPAPVRSTYPQSSTQKRIFILEQMNPGTTAYNVPLFFRAEGKIDIERCEYAFRSIINRHEALRTSFHLEHEEPVQQIHDEVPFSIELIGGEAEDFESVAAGFIRWFDLSKPPLMRVAVRQVNAHTAWLLIDMHHIVTDGESYMNLIREFSVLYSNREIVPLNIQYKDYAVWQQKREQSGLAGQQKAFWLEQFAGIPEVASIPTDFLRPQVNSYNGATATFELNTAECAALKAVCKTRGVTMYTLLLTSLNVLISKLSGLEDITVGTSAAGRQHLDTEQLIGVFINTLPIRNFPSGGQHFADFLDKVKYNVIKCFANQDFPYEQLVASLDMAQDLSHNPLFDIMFEYYDYDIAALEVSDMRLVQIGHNNTSSKLDLSFRVFERESDCIFYLDYRTDLFKSETVSRYIGYFKRILSAVAANVDIRLCDIDIMPVKEYHLLRDVYNGTALAYSRDSNLVLLFEQQVKIHPDRLAAADGKKQLTYSQLNEQANKVANYLVSEGIAPGNIVGLMFERSLDMVVSMLGVLKSGAAYLPIDPALPEQRISYMLNQSRAAFLLSQSNFLDMYAAYLPAQAIDATLILSQRVDNVSVHIHPEDLAYCIFTSGSTGKPKGVMINHRSVVNLVKGLEQEVYSSYGGKALKVALLASFSFDASVQQIYGALLQGHSLIVSDDDSRRDGEKLRHFYTENSIDLSDGTPTHLRLLTDTLPKNASLGNLSSWILAGEALPKELVKEFYTKAADSVQLYNFYGPTETCVDSTCFKVSAQSLDDYPFIPIGRPLPNERIYITDAFGRMVPPGVAGELCIAGDGLAQRYVGDEAATSEKFRIDWIEGEGRIYRTGDIARWLPDGNLEYRGRADSQVKLRGYRIELLEIENQLSTYPGINYCAVKLAASGEEKFLVAYYESADEVETADLRHYLAQNLPDYMIPSYYMRVSRLPLTTNGKVDRNALPAFSLKSSRRYVPPATETEKKLVAIWADVLKLNSASIGITDNFFDLGGQSLKLVFLANRIKEVFNVSLSLMKLTALKNIQELAKETGPGNAGSYIEIPKAAETEFYPLSYAQQQFYLLNQLSTSSVVYNQPQALLISGNADREKLEYIFRAIIAHHESYRTSFRLINDSPVQCILKEVPFALEYYESSSEEESRKIISAFIRPFDLTAAPLLRACLIRLDGKKHILVIDRHHIVSDGIGIDIFMHDFKALYSGTPLSSTSLQYKDYAVWQQGEIYQKSLGDQKRYWNNLFAAEYEALALHTDYERPGVTTYRGAAVDFEVGPKDARMLNNLAKSLGITAHSLYLAVFKIFLHKLTGQKDLVVGTPVSGRRHTAIENIIGVFVNVLAIRSQLKDNCSLYDFLQEVHHNAVQGLENQDYPYEKLVADLGVVRKINRNALFDVMFVYREGSEFELALADAIYKPYALEADTSQMDLMLHVSADENGAKLSFQYAADLFRHSTIEKFVQYFKLVTGQVISGTPVSDISILNNAESRLIEQFTRADTSFEVKENIVDLFKKQVTAYPERAAVVYGGTGLTYKELDESSNQLAAYLIDQGLAKGDIAALMLGRSTDMITAILAVLKCGAAYLPVDYMLPFERVKYMLDASGAAILLTHNEHAARFRDITAVHDIKAASVSGYQTAAVAVERSASDLAYCIFTSGSTGTPKGVLIEDGSIVNLAEGLARSVYNGLGSPLRVGLIASFSFDASCQQIYAALLNGHCLYICNEKERMDGAELYRFFEKNSIHISDGTPTHLSMFLRSLNNEINLPDFNVWLLAGEMLFKEPVQEFYNYPGAGSIVLYNLYGPTETCVDSACFRINPEKLHTYKATVPIGRPLPNESIYIVDEYGNSVPVGVAGELCIAGAGLARGYLDGSSGNSRFVQNWIKGAHRVYRTGDRAYWQPDGNIICLGRMDNQIKLRGYRIEPGEIEQVLLTHPGISEAAVVLKTVEGEKYLTAYCIAGEALNNDTLRDYLSRYFPEYMIPSFFVQLQKMPLTTSGKLDKEALPTPLRSGTAIYEAAASDTEKKVAAIWAAVLNLEAGAISVKESFLQLGGNSLMAVQIANKIRREFSIELKLAEIFQKPTIQQQANFIDAAVWIETGALFTQPGNREINI